MNPTLAMLVAALLCAILVRFDEKDDLAEHRLDALRQSDGAAYPK